MTARFVFTSYFLMLPSALTPLQKFTRMLCALSKGDFLVRISSSLLLLAIITPAMFPSLWYVLLNQSTSDFTAVTVTILVEASWYTWWRLSYIAWYSFRYTFCGFSVDALSAVSTSLAGVSSAAICVVTCSAVSVSLSVCVPVSPSVSISSGNISSFSCGKVTVCGSSSGYSQLFSTGSNNRNVRHATSPNSNASDAVMTILCNSFFLSIGLSFIFSCKNSKSLALSDSWFWLSCCFSSIYNIIPFQYLLSLLI